MSDLPQRRRASATPAGKSAPPTAARRGGVSPSTAQDEAAAVPELLVAGSAFSAGERYRFRSAWHPRHDGGARTGRRGAARRRDRALGRASSHTYAG